VYADDAAVRGALICRFTAAVCQDGWATQAIVLEYAAIG
jgi:hypothetical protein